jgi:hypothetical protein
LWDPAAKVRANRSCPAASKLPVSQRTSSRVTVTEPDGVPPLAEVTVTVYRTQSPATDGFTLELTEVVVAAFPTVCMSAVLLLVPKPAVPV